MNIKYSSIEINTNYKENEILLSLESVEQIAEF